MWVFIGHLSVALMQLQVVIIFIYDMYSISSPSFYDAIRDGRWMILQQSPFQVRLTEAEGPICLDLKFKGDLKCSYLLTGLSGKFHNWLLCTKVQNVTHTLCLDLHI